jgi:single-strand DNA-binding protein
MVLIGRVTADAVVKTLKDERKVVNFNVAINDGYKDKKTEKWVSIPSFYSCSYWLSPAVAERLKKGNLVELTGRLSVNCYKDMEGEAQASLNFHVDSIKVHGVAKKEEAKQPPTPAPTATDDLPF